MYRIVAAGLIPLTMAPFAAGSLNPVSDSILCALLVVHSHIGFEYVLLYTHFTIMTLCFRHTSCKY
jgi:hypothetical protein